jgi:hypothetical protein
MVSLSLLVIIVGRLIILDQFFFVEFPQVFD